MNQPIAPSYSKADLERMNAPMVEKSRRMARYYTAGILVAGLVVSVASVQQRWILDDRSQDRLQLLITFVVLGVVPAFYARNRILGDIVRFPRLMRTGAVVPARLMSARGIGKLQRVGVAWNEGDKPANGHVDMLELLGYVARDTAVLMHPTNDVVGVVLNNQLYLGRRDALEHQLSRSAGRARS